MATVTQAPSKLIFEALERARKARHSHLIAAAFCTAPPTSRTAGLVIAARRKGFGPTRSADYSTNSPEQISRKLPTCTDCPDLRGLTKPQQRSS